MIVYIVLTGIQCYCDKTPGTPLFECYFDQACEVQNGFCMTSFYLDDMGRQTVESECIDLDNNPQWKSQCSESRNTDTFNIHCCFTDDCNREIHLGESPLKPLTSTMSTATNHTDAATTATPPPTGARTSGATAGFVNTPPPDPSSLGHDRKGTYCTAELYRLGSLFHVRLFVCFLLISSG